MTYLTMYVWYVHKELNIKDIDVEESVYEYLKTELKVSEDEICFWLEDRKFDILSKLMLATERSSTMFSKVSYIYRTNRRNLLFI